MEAVTTPATTTTTISPRIAATHNTEEISIKQALFGTFLSLNIIHILRNTYLLLVSSITLILEMFHEQEGKLRYEFLLQYLNEVNKAME